MCTQAGSDIAYYPPDVVGRLRAGTIRTGDIYNLESWQDPIVVGEIDGTRIPAEYGLDIDRTRSYVIATTKYVAGELGALTELEEKMMLRDATIAHAQRHGFS